MIGQRNMAREVDDNIDEFIAGHDIFITDIFIFDFDISVVSDRDT